jgi:hypothetical protein
MQITVSIPDEAAAKAQALGLGVEEYLKRLVAEDMSSSDERFVRFGPGPYTPEEAAAGIRELRKGVTLGGLKIKDLINEGRR